MCAARKFVMLVDDDPDYREAAIALLGLAGYDVVPAENGLEALQLLEAGAVRPDLILLDLAQPVMGGRQFVRELKARPALAGISIALVSGEHDLSREAAALAVADYLMKPYNTGSLLALVARLAGSPVPASVDGRSRLIGAGHRPHTSTSFPSGSRNLANRP